MGLIKIIANNIELDFVKESLSIKTENNALSRDFKVSATSYPFLIVENKNANKGLGTRDLASIKKKKVIEVIVFEGINKYYGELQILSYLNGFRKCNLKYSSLILSIMNKKIADFMPVVSVIPDEINPVPYSEKSDVPLSGSEHWQTYPLSFLDKKFPEVKYQFPTMKWLNKFGVNMEADDPWHLYNNSINEYNEDGLIENTYNIVADVCTVENRNVVSPQIFLLAPAFYALQSLGFTLSGNFPISEFIKRLLFQSSKNNLTETHPLKDVEFITMPTSFTHHIEYDGGTPIYEFYRSYRTITATVAGNYFFEYDFDEPSFAPVPGFVTRKRLQIFYIEKNAFQHFENDPAQRYKGVIKVEITEDLVGIPIILSYESPTPTLPAYTIKKTIGFLNIFHQMHPTIQLGRYLPDWTFGTYLNEMQNLFNLEIIPDDFSKRLFLNFNEETIATTATYIEKKSLIMNSYDPTPYNAFLLKYDNEEDEALWINTESVTVYNKQTSDFSANLSSKFKHIPVTYTAELSEALDSKNGTGLMIYDPANKPYISADFLGQTLKMNGNKGIYQVYWKKWLKLLLNSSSIELTGPYTETEIRKILKLKRIFIDHQEYIIAATEYTESQQDNFKIKFSLQSITF